MAAGREAAVCLHLARAVFQQGQAAQLDCHCNSSSVLINWNAMILESCRAGGGGSSRTMVFWAERNCTKYVVDPVLLHSMLVLSRGLKVSISLHRALIFFSWTTELLTLHRRNAEAQVVASSSRSKCDDQTAQLPGCHPAVPVSIFLVFFLFPSFSSSSSLGNVLSQPLVHD